MAKANVTKDVKNPKTNATQQGALQARATLAGGAMGTAIELPNGMRDRIAQKAHELWEQRGYREGHDLEDWLEAEAIVMDEIHEARE
ncbi:DUF2934 domain-containing protein [Nitrospira defluvii]|uniref:DUF2934 domain-containing protein n=1 Tax=Nitrospira defluvii TaxID=330214 RepID=A0ABM8R9A0_9BACT|nr:DUF2934 domain-containing protein [Nitrospira defluvii]CAE6740325.1 conserved hypothetical protein [Nitrospira defluvii]